MNETPIYKSKRSARNLWQEYRIYRDRLELQSWITLRTFVVSVQAIRGIELRPPLFRRKGMTWGLKLDPADLFRHVLLTRTSGLMKRIAFTPDDPEQFVAVASSVVPDGRAGGRDG